MKKHLGFTLAEVLITLGIIGVVAAMTIPTLMSNTNSSEMKTAFKKILSAMNQAVTMSVALNYVDFADITQTNTADDSLYQILNDKMHIVKLVTSATYANDEESRTMGFAQSNYTLFFADGMVLSYDPTTMHHCTNYNVAARGGRCTAIVDVNGKRKPNKLSNCMANMNQGSNNGYVSADNQVGGSAVDNKGISHTGACHDGNAQIIDQFSVVFKGQQVLPNGYAARYVLYNN